MKREQIEKAALLCAGAGEYGECPYNPDAKKGFIAGADWRINSVWHSPTEEQEAYRPILVEFTHEDGDLGFELGLRQIGLSKEAESNMIRWAYLDDLLPERKEESK